MLRVASPHLAPGLSSPSFTLWRARPRYSKPDWRNMMLNAQALADLYVAAWNEPDAAKRSFAIAALWAPDALSPRGAGGYAARAKLTLAAPGTSAGHAGIRYRDAPA